MHVALSRHQGSGLDGRSKGSNFMRIINSAIQREHVDSCLNKREFDLNANLNGLMKVQVAGVEVAK
jgi:hypothetical protein